MRFKLSRAATLMDKYGWSKGLRLYFQLKFNRVTSIKLPAIEYPFSLRKHTTDTAVFEQIFLHGEYDLDFSFVPAVIVDAGANIGLFSILLKNKFPGAKIICIEPGKENFDLLNKNLSPYKGIDILCAGLWHSDTRLHIVDKFKAGYSAFVTEEDVGSGDTGAISMDTLIRNNNLERIDILKIDIEGSEKAVFLKNYEHWLPKVKMIVIELHDWLMPGCSKPLFDAIQKTFSNYSYTVCGENTVIVNKDLN